MKKRLQALTLSIRGILFLLFRHRSGRFGHSPQRQFSVEYLNGDGNGLAVLPINGHSLIFSGVLSADRSRYAAGGYIWWDVGSRGIHLYSDTIQGKQQTACQVGP